RSKSRSIRAEILLVDNIAICDDECHHARRPILRGIGDDGECAGARVDSAFWPDGQCAKVVAMEQHGGTAGGLPCRFLYCGKLILRTLSIGLRAIVLPGSSEVVADSNRRKFVL